jgi:hypothetical protein
MELFAATSFGRIATRRTSMTDAFSASRMRTPRGPSRTLWSLHRIVSTSDVSLSPTGTPESKSFSPDVLSIYRHVDIAAYRDRSGFDRLVRGPGFASAVSRQDGPKPENAFRRVQESTSFHPKTTCWRDFLIPLQPVRTVSPSTPPRPYVRQATDFLLASALF